MATFREAVAGEVRAHLARRRMTALDLARKVGWTQSYTSRRINGRVGYSVDDLDAIAGALGVPVIELFPESARVLNHRYYRAPSVPNVRPNGRRDRPNGSPSNGATTRPATRARRIDRLATVP